MTHKAKFLLAALALLAFTSALDQPAGTKLWEFYVGAPIQSSPAVGADGTVYFGADNGKLYAFDPQGQGKWEFPAGEAMVASPALAVDGTVIVGSQDGFLYAVGADGVERWRFRANGKIVSSPAIGLDGAVHFGSMRNTVYAVNPDGTKRWEFAADDAIVSSPVVGRDGTTYVISLGGTLYALDLAGKVKWTFKAGEKVNSSPALAADGTIYFGAFDGHVYAIRPNGSKLWTAATGAAVRGSASVGPDGVIYIGSDDRKLYAFAPDGFKLWSYNTGGWVRSTPAVSADGTIYFGSYDNSLHAVSAEGVKVWEFTTDSAISSSPAIAPNGAIYVGGWSKRFYALKGTAGLVPNAWARFRGDARQSAFAQMEFAPAQYVRATPKPAFPVEDAKPPAVTGKAAAAEEFARAQAAREQALAAKSAAAARAKPAPQPKSPPLNADAEAKRFAKAQADAAAKAAREDKAAREALQKAEAEASRKALAENARVLKEAELARQAQTEADRRRANSAADLARAAKRDSELRAAAQRKAAEDAERLAKTQQEADRKAQEIEAARRAAEAKAQAEADRKAAMEQARLTKVQHDAEQKAALEAARKAKAQQLAQEEADKKAAAELARQAKLKQDADLKAAADAARASKLQQEAEQKAAAETARVAKLQQEAAQKAAAEAQIAESRRLVEESKRMLKEADAARKQQALEEAQRAAAAAEIARLAKKEAEQRAAIQMATAQAEAKRLQAEAQAAEAARLKSEAEAARQAKAQAEAMRKAQEIEAKNQQAAAARELAEARAKADSETRAAAEAEKVRAKEQEIARKVAAEAEKTARAEAERQAREAARQAALEQEAERRRAAAERQKSEPAEGGFFRRLFGFGSSPAVKVVAESTVPTTPEVPVAAPVPMPAPAVAVPAPAPAVSIVSPAAPGVPMRIISDSADLVRPAAPAPAPAPSFFTPGQPTVDPLAAQIEQMKQQAAAAQAQPIQPVAPTFVAPAVPAIPVVQEVVTEEPAPAKSGGFWTGVRNFFIRKPAAAQQPQAVQPKSAQARPTADWPPSGIVVRPAKPVAQVQAEVPPGLAPGGVTVTNFPRVQYAPVSNQAGLFLPRAMAAQTNIPGMPQPPAPPREVREMRPTRTGGQGLASELPGATAPFEMIQGRVKAVLRVYSTGAGTVVPDLNGAELEVGQTYTLEAQPARGAAFAGWSGSIETNTPTLRFIMRNGTVLAANFQFAHQLERELPEVAIISPADGTRLATGAFQLQGAARDNVALARVEVSVNDGPWEPAQGTDQWTFPSGARPGPNYIRVRAVDQAGNYSPAVLRTLHHSVPSPLTVRVKGAGAVEPDWQGRALEVGAGYELRATPAPGYVFTGWSGDVTSTNGALQFTMRSNLIVEANFAPRVATLARGVFNGLLYPTAALAPGKCGFFQIEVGSDGGFTGFLRQGAASHPLIGQFDLEGRAVTMVTRAGKPAVTVSLQLDTIAGERVNGRFVDEEQVVEVFGYRQGFDGHTTVTPLAGRYTFVIPSATNSAASPAGDAFGEIVVDAAGRVRISGELPDGTPVRHEAVLGRNGPLPLHVPLAGGRGMLLGWITLTNNTRLDAYGEVIWHKPLSPQDRYYPSGFSTRRHLFGARYTPSASAVMSGDRRTPGVLSGGDLDKVVLGEAGTSAPGTTVLHAIHQFHWNFRPDTGYVEGTFIHPATRQETTFRGALLQKVGWTSGYFLGQNHSGVVHLRLPQ